MPKQTHTKFERRHQATAGVRRASSLSRKQEREVRRKCDEFCIARGIFTRTSNYLVLRP